MTLWIDAHLSPAIAKWITENFQVGAVPGGEEIMNEAHEIRNVRVTDTHLELVIDGKERRFELAAISPALSRATRVEREKFEVSPSGYGIHWPLADEDLSIDGLPGILHAPLRRAG